MCLAPDTDPMFEFCPHCNQDALIKVEAVYDGFTKTGETRTCTSCGKEVEANVPASSASTEKKDPLAALFGEELNDEAPDLFDVEAETSRLCRKCRHYVLHPFKQVCGLHDREVQATDSCPQFEAKLSD